MKISEAIKKTKKISNGGFVNCTIEVDNHEDGEFKTECRIYFCYKGETSGESFLGETFNECFKKIKDPINYKKAIEEDQEDKI